VAVLWTALFVFSIVLQYVQLAAPPAALGFTSSDSALFSPTAFQDDNGANSEWDNAGNALAPADDGQLATATGSGDVQQYFTFNIPAVPAGAIVHGISVTANAFASSASCDLEVGLSANNGSNFTNRSVDLGTSAAGAVTAGGPTDDWGIAWDTARVDNTNFRLRVNTVDPGQGCGSGDTYSLDWIKVQLHYRTINDGTSNAPLSSAICETADFNFVIDMSGSIGPQYDGDPGNLQALKDGIAGFIAAFEVDGDGRYSATRFNEANGQTLTAGFVTAATVLPIIGALSGPSGLTPTGDGINDATANGTGGPTDRAGIPNIMFVLTDGSPNNPPGSPLTDSATWVGGADAAIDEANQARAAGYIVKAVYLSAAGDPGDTNLPFTSAGDAVWATAVMTEIGGDEPPLQSNFADFADDLFEAIGCEPPSVDITKTADAGTVDVGSPVGFTITVENNGGETATNVVVTDSLPAGLTWTISPAVTGCSINTAPNPDVLTCTFASLAPGAEKVIHIVSGNTGPANCATINNTAQVDWTDNGDPKSASASVNVRCPDVSVVKTPDGGSVQAGDPAIFSIVVSNAGPAPATGVTLTDNLPAGYVWAVGGPDGAACSINTAPSPDVLTCTFGTLAASATRTVTLTAQTSGANCAVIPNVASVTSTNEPQGALGNNSDSASIDVLCGNIVITKVAEDDVISAGDEIRFTVTVTNTGDGEARGIVISDTLPAGIAWSDDEGKCTISGGILTCNVGTLAAGAWFAVDIFGPTDPQDCGTVTNTASVTTANDGSGQASDSVDVLCPDVTVTKVADDEEVSAGQEIGFTITISNAGPGAAAGAFATDTLSGSGWTIQSQDGGWSLVGNSLTFAGDLAAGASSSVHVVRDTSAEDCGTVPNTVSVGASNEPANDQLPNQASDSTDVLCPDITVDKSAAVSPISAGEVASFVIEVWNQGPGTALDVTLSDTLPAGVAWVVDATDPAGIACEIEGDALTCELGDLEPEGEGDENHVFIYLSGATSITGCAEGAFELINTVSVSASNEPETLTEDNSDDATIEVDCPELGIGKDADHAVPVSAGNPIGFTVTLANFGDGTAFDVSVDDLLPAGFEWVIDSQDGGWSLDEQADGLHLVWGPGDLPSGSRAVHVVSDTDQDDCGLVPNSATAFMGQEEIGSDDAAEEVICPDIDIDKTTDDADGVVGQGQTVSYTIEVFVLDGEVASGVVSDVLPVGQTYVEGSQSSVPAATSFEVSPDGRTLTWTYDFILSGDPAATIDYDVTIDPGTPTGELTNSAEFCVAIGPDTLCDGDDETVRVPELTIEKSVSGNSGGTTGGGTPIAIVGDSLTYTLEYTLANGPVQNGVITDVLPAGLAYVDGSATDNAEFSFTSATANGDGTTTLRWDAATVTAAGSLSYEVDVLAEAERDTDLVNVATIDSDETPPDDDDQPVTVPPTPVYGLVIDKTNDAPVDTIDLGDGVTIDLPSAEEGDTVTFTLAYTLAGDPVTEGVITDVLPTGIDYVAGSATSNAEFSFVGYDAATRTLRWEAATVTVAGSVSYKGLVADGAVDLAQPLVNVATIDSVETEPDSDDSQVFVQEEAGVVVTPPPTDTFATPQAAGSPGFTLMLVLLFLAGLALSVGFITPVPERVRRRDR
jgi:uncharacterized repeat protein (TIGR01451 family)